jgi:hypothetical protein
MHVHYAIQTHDLSNNQGFDRYATTDKSLVVEKCVTSLLVSIEQAIKERPDSKHTAVIFDDHSSEKTVSFLRHAANHFNKGNFELTFEHLEKKGLMSSVRSCYEYLQNNGQELVYQVQDDFLFEPGAIFEMIDVFVQLSLDVNTHAIVSPLNDPKIWRTHYRYKQTPRMIFPGAYRYWMQYYDTPCSFLTSKDQFGKHWDLYDAFLACSPNDTELEAKTINHMLVKRGVLGVLPFDSLALHMGYEIDKEPYIDWEKRWDAVPKL